MSQSDSWDVRVEEETVVVELPAELKLDKDTGEQINKEFAEATARPQSKYQLTLLETENPLSSGLFEEVKKGGEIAVENGITHWAIVVNENIKGMAFDSNLDDLKTAVFENRSEAEEWFSK
jgi:hypothetical protein